MNINITLLIQIFNFIIAYVIVRTLLLKPAVAVILQEEEYRAHLDASIESNLKANKAKEETMAHRWTTAKEIFASRAPDVVQAEQALRVPTEAKMPKIPEIDKRVLKPMAADVADELVERIRHVR